MCQGATTQQLFMKLKDFISELRLYMSRLTIDSVIMSKDVCDVSAEGLVDGRILDLSLPETLIPSL